MKSQVINVRHCHICPFNDAWEDEAKTMESYWKMSVACLEFECLEASCEYSPCYHFVASVKIVSLKIDVKNIEIISTLHS